MGRRIAFGHQLLFGALGGILGGAAFACAASCGNDVEGLGGSVLFIGWSIGATVGSLTGVYWSGSSRTPVSGSFLATAGGSLLGASVTGLYFVLGGLVFDYGYVVATAAPLLGSLAGFEISASQRRRRLSLGRVSFMGVPRPGGGYALGLKANL
ncbi:MAG: hypothetical protein OEZ54_08985 [Gemmatimonadota bacterium]|nr:hypothetical protein [Gemmatimonadota bacterium]